MKEGFLPLCLAGHMGGGKACASDQRAAGANFSMAKRTGGMWGGGRELLFGGL